MEKNQFDGLIALKLVAEKKSFIAAAEELGISSAAVSKMISNLERKMGITLLTRTTRTVRLSQAGSTFLEQAGPAMEQIIIAQENAKSHAIRPSGLLRVNVPAIFYNYYMKEIIKNFLQKYPEVTFEVYSDDQASDIFEQGFDAGVRADDILAKDLIALKLSGPIEYVTAASLNYLQKHGTPKHPKELLNHNCIRLRFGSSSSIYDKWEFQENKREFSVKVNGNLILNNSESIRYAALTGEGIIFTDLACIKDDVKNKKVKVILSKYQVTSTGYYLYYPHKKHISPALRAFIEHFKEQGKML